MTAIVVAPRATPSQLTEWAMAAGFRTVEPRCGAIDTHSSPHGRGMALSGENSDAVSVEPISPELALVDPDLATRARAALADPVAAPRPPRQVVRTPGARTPTQRAYPFWARITAALWLLVLGILVGGAAIPHAQDRPRVLPPSEDPMFCSAPPAKPSGG